MSDTGNPPTDGPTKIRRLIFVLACLTSFLLYLHRYTWGFVKPYVAEEYGWNLVEMGYLDSCFQGAYAVGQIPGGILCDWFGPHVLLGVLILLWSFAMGGTALFSTMAGMGTVRVMFGLAQSGCYSSLSKVTKVWFPITVRTAVQGSVAASGRFGGAASNVLFATVLMGAIGFGWRGALGVFTVAGLLFGVVFLYLFRNTPREHPWANEAEADQITTGDPESAVGAGSKQRWSVLFRSANMWIFWFQQFTSAYADNLYQLWIPTYLIIQKGVDLSSAGWLAALPLLGGGFGGLTGGSLQSYLIVRTGNRRWCRSLIGFSGKLLATVFMFYSLSFDDAATIMGILFLVKFFGDWSQPTVWGTVTDIAGRNSASVFGSVNTVGSIAGFVAGPTMGGLVLWFSMVAPIENESILPNDSTATVVEYAPLAHKGVEVATFSGTIRSEAGPLATFRVSEDGAFTIDPADPSAPAPIPDGSKVDSKRGSLTLAWSAAPGAHEVVVDYSYRDYGSGWTALFYAMGLIYLGSAVSWLFIDCTKKLPEN